MGSSEAAGYVDLDGSIMGWLNELAFAPVDYHPDAPLDERDENILEVISVTPLTKSGFLIYRLALPVIRSFPTFCLFFL